MADLNRKKRNVARVLTVSFIVALVAAAVFFIRGLHSVTTDDAYVEGTIYNIASKISGTVQTVCVDDNQFVKKGALLVEVDPIDYEARLLEAEASLNAEKARLEDMQHNIQSAQANLQMQKVNLRQAKIDLERAQKLYKQEAITKEKFEKSQTAHALAHAQAKATLEQLYRAQAQKRLQEALVAQREAAYKIAQLNISYTKIYASGDGYVTKKAVERGNQIHAGQALMALVSLDDIWIVANFKETQLKRVKPGQRVNIKVDTYPGKNFTGKVDSIMAGTGAVFSLFPPENALGNYVKVVQRVPVKILLDRESDPRHMLRLGMSVVPTIITSDE